MADKKPWYKRFWSWFTSGKVSTTENVPFKKPGEQFKGIKYTLPWWGEPKDKEER